MIKDTKKKLTGLKGDVHAAKCGLIDAEKSGEFARIVSARRRVRLAESALADFDFSEKGQDR